ncbi:MAG: LLM class flavin-dependent oxidoreductase [Planctomycetota bacterium]|nr:MAG: LLM class flavin-dependent oxidoreductase [Planctomycetota bacterium]
MSSAAGAWSRVSSGACRRTTRPTTSRPPSPAGVSPRPTRLIRKAWTEPDIFAWKGEFYDFPTVSIWPRPVQQPHPTVLYSANSETSAVFAAERQALIGAIHLYSRDAMDAVGRSAQGLPRAPAELGNTPAPEHLLVGFSTCIAETDAEAQDTLGPALDYQYNVLSGTYNAEKRRIAAQEPGYGFSPVEEHPPTLEERIERGMVLCGSPRTVIDQIHAARERVGLGVISMHMQVGNMPNDAVLNSMRWFNTGVRGAFGGGAGA